MPPSSPKKTKKKRDANALMKAPQAPKRFKSSYIIYFTTKQNETKAALKAEAKANGGDVAAAVNVTNVSKRSSENWRNISAEERAYWEEEAAKDKERYEREKNSYTGPWQVPKKRAKKDPNAPKRPMSAFLYFSQDRRQKIKAENPVMKNTDVSRVLGKMWGEASDEEKRPHKEIELKERAKYKIVKAKFDEEKKVREEAEKKALEEQQRQFALQPPPPPPPPPVVAPATMPQAYAMPSPSHAPPPLQQPMQGDPAQQQSLQHPPPPPQGYDPNMMYRHQMLGYGMPPPNAPYYAYPPPPQQGYYASYPPPLAASNGQPVVPGPIGAPQGAAAHPMQPPPPQQYTHCAPPAPPHSMPPQQQGQYPPLYGAPPQQQPQQSPLLQQHQEQQAAPLATAPPQYPVFNEDGSGQMMAYPPFPEPEQTTGGVGELMTYPPQ